MPKTPVMSRRGVLRMPQVGHPKESAILIGGRRRISAARKEHWLAVRPEISS
jgi:hypothetical protein